MMLLERVGTPETEGALAAADRATARCSSAFAMTEPDGCGSDPSLTYTTATRGNAGWVIKGRKWFITGAEEARAFHPDRPHLATTAGAA